MSHPSTLQLRNLTSVQYNISMEDSNSAPTPLPPQVQSAATQIRRMDQKQETAFIKQKRRSSTIRLADAADDAAYTLVEIARGHQFEPRDRIKASESILDRVGVGTKTQEQQGNTSAIPIQFLTAALAGIAALAGRDTSAFGDMTDLQDRLAANAAATQFRNAAMNAVDGDFEELMEPEMIAVTVPPTIAAAMTTVHLPRSVEHRRKTNGTS